MKIKKLYDLFLGCHSVCTDTRKLSKNDIFFALSGDNFNGNEFANQALKQGAKYAVIDQIAFADDQTILVENSLKTLQELALYHRKKLDIPIIALTGSNGKTTTKELINSVLSKKYKTTATSGNYNNHIGVPLTLLAMNKETEIGIVEMGANHQKEIEFLCKIAQPDYGYITNFGKAHLEGFGGVEGVIKGKSELYDYLKANDKTMFVNEDDPIQIEKTQGFKTFTFSNNKPSSDVNIEFVEANPFVKISYKQHIIQTNLIGAYNFKNISVAIAIGKYFDVDDQDMIDAIKSYAPTNNRSQILEKGSNKIVLDAYNANPNSMEAALESFCKLKGHKYVFLGDMFELGEESAAEHQKIVDLAERKAFNKLYLVGENFSKTKTSNSDTWTFKTFEELSLDFKNGPEIEKSNILIKGSRGMAMERVLDIL